MKINKIKCINLKIGDIACWQYSPWTNSPPLYYLISKIKYRKKSYGVELEIYFFCLKNLKIYKCFYFQQTDIDILDFS